MGNSQNIPIPTAEYLSNYGWIQSHLDELVQSYPDQWVAAANGMVISAGKDLGIVTQEASNACPTGNVAFEFIASASMIF